MTSRNRSAAGSAVTGQELLARTTRVSLELSNQCNLAHAHTRCPAHVAGILEILPTAIVHDVIDTLAKHGFNEGRYLAFHLYNEPLLDPRLLEFIRYARTRCPALGIIIWSNGWYLNDSLLGDLIDAGTTHLMLSAYSDEDEARFRDMEERLRRRLAAAPPSHPVHYAVRRQHGLDERLTMLQPLPDGDPRPCYEPLDDLTVRCGGELGLCCYDWARQVVFGSLADTSFEVCLADALTRMAALQQELVRGERRLPVCRACLFPRRSARERVAYTWPAATLVWPPTPSPATTPVAPPTSVTAGTRTSDDGRAALPPASAGDYWCRRRELRYYSVVRQLLEELGPGELLIDVGSSDTPVATYGSFARRLAIDLARVPSLPGVETRLSAWQDIHVEEPATALTCLQVLEHLPDEELRPFARKLLAAARTVIVSIPYRWPRGQDEEHRQDPMDEAVLREIMGREPLETLIVTERPNRITHRRLIAVYDGDTAAPTGGAAGPGPDALVPSRGPAGSVRPARADS